MDVEDLELVKCVVGLSSDLAEIEGYQVFINGKPLAKTLAIWNTQPLPPNGNGIPLRVF
jgi:hypothetical protein